MSTSSVQSEADMVTRGRRASASRAMTCAVMCVVMCAATCAIVAMAGCSGPALPKEKFDPDNKPAANRATLPKANDVVRAYNRRVADISRMRTPVSAVIDVPRVDENGKLTGERQKDQLDGNLQFIQPDRVSLRMDKVQQTVFSLGSGGGKYWFITMGDEPVAYTGSMSKATLAKAKSLGLPIHPLDLLELMAVTPMPENAKLSWWGEYVRVVAPARWGTREVLVNAKTFEPAAVWLRDASGKIAVWAETTNFKSVAVEGKGTTAASVPGRVRAVVPGAAVKGAAGKNTAVDGASYIELFLAKPENTGNRIREKQFQLDAVLEAASVKEIVDIDVDVDIRATGVKPVQGTGSGGK